MLVGTEPVCHILGVEGDFDTALTISSTGSFQRFALKCPAMATCIVSLFHDSCGFVLGADGLRKDREGNIVSETAQKLFPIVGGGSHLAFACAGATALDFFDGTRFNFIEHIQAAAALLEAARFKTLDEYVRGVMGLVYSAFVEANPRGKSIRGYPLGSMPDNYVFRALFVGYLDGRPLMVKSLLPHNKTEVDLPQTSDQVSSPGSPEGFSVPRFIWEQYKWYDVKGVEPLENLTKLIRDFIKVCKDSPHPECANMGGHIHIAQIGWNNFNWIIPPVG